jgi:acyl-CoA synthetase (AMP-forming)/AMP-acid ligase II
MAEDSRNEKFEAGIMRDSTDQWDPSKQWCYEKALEKEWTTFYDLIPDQDTPFLHSMDGRKPLTFKALKEFCAGDKPDVLGLGREDRLCTAIPNGVEAAVAFFAFSLRCTFAPLNIGLSRDEFEFEFVDLPAKCLVVMQKEGLSEDDAKQSGHAISVARKTKVEKLLQMNPDKEIAGLFSLTKHAAGRPLKGDPLGPCLESVKREQLALVLHTSGTTKKPKIVPLTHQNIACGALCIASTVQMTPDDVCINTMPLFHIHGQIVNLLASAVVGTQVLGVAGVFNAANFHKGLETQPLPTWYSAVPTMHLQILQMAQEMGRVNGKVPENKLKLIRNCSAALLPSVADDMEKTLKVAVMPTYAMTESMPISSNPRFGVRKLRSVGPRGGPEMRIMNGHPDNTELKVGEEGEICVKMGPVTSGYEFREHMDADPNIEAFGDGWLRTGDKGWLDTDGYCYLSGRFKEIINRAGEKISPFEVEEALRQHEAIKDIIAFSVPHETTGETVGVVVVQKEGQKVNLKELRTWAQKNERLQAKWLPEQLVWMPSIPKGPTGKPMRINLSKKLGLEPISTVPRELEHDGNVK